MDTKNEVITITLPATIAVKGARGLTRELDVSKLDPATLTGVIDYWFGVMTQRSSAGVEGFEKKVETEVKMADRLVTFDWKPGSGGGGGGKLDITAQATRRVLAMLFESKGYTKSAAEKASKGKEAWQAFFMLALTLKENRPATPEEIAAEIDSQEAAIASLIATAKGQIEKENADKAALAEGLTF